MRPVVVLVAAAAMAVLAGACSRGGDSSVAADAVATVGRHTLTQAEIRATIPGGTNAGDSAALANAYIRNWIDEHLIEEIAARDVDMDEIQRLTDDYRRRLITTYYRREMAQRADAVELSEDSIRAYYDAHSSGFVLERPLVKGIYLKVADNSPELARLKRFYRSDRPVDLDRLESAAASTALHYDYFRDRWVDWEQIENRIPADFQGGGDAFLRAGRPLDFSAGGYTYLLSVSDYLPTGSAMPYEAARPIIRERLLNRLRRVYDERLRNELYQRALDDGTLILHNR